jgi:hypothetical protein
MNTNLVLTTFGSLVSVRNVQGGEKREGFFTALVLTPFSVAETPESRPSLLYCLTKNHESRILFTSIIVVTI